MDELYQSDEDEVDLPEVSLRQSEGQAGSSETQEDVPKEIICNSQDQNSPNVITIEQSEDEADVEESIFRHVLAESLTEAPQRWFGSTLCLLLINPLPYDQPFTI